MYIESEGKFFTNFNEGIPSEFTVNTETANTESVQNFDGRGTLTNIFAGNFLRNVTDGPGDKITLTLENLPTHTSIDLNFLLAIIDTWDGNLEGFGPDLFNVTVDGVSIFSETFTNIDSASQSYIPPIGVQLGSEEFFSDTNNSFSSARDSAYNMGLDPTFDNIAHTGNTLTIEWFADGDGWESGANIGDQNYANETWAIDNVEVILNGTDEQAPELANNNGLSPADDSTGVAADTDLVIAFDEPVIAGTGKVTIYNADGTVFEEIDIPSDAVTFDGNSVTINPINDLESSASYYVEVDSGAITDEAGNDFAGISGDSTWNFTAADTTAPGLAISNGLSPADDSTDVPSNSNLVITFDEDVQAGIGNIIIKDADGNVIETIDITSDAVTFDGNTVTINPAEDLGFSTGYNVEIESGAIEDLAGNDFAGINDPTTWNFTTAAEPDTTAPGLASTNGLSPADDSTNVPSNSDLVITFDEPVIAGTGKVTIYNTDGTVFEEIDITSDAVTINGDSVTINPTNDLESSASYYVEVDSGAIQDEAGNDFAGISGDSTWNFTAADTTTPDTITPDITPPGISSSNGLSPADDSTNVPTNTNLLITFDEEVQAGSGNLLVKKTDGTLVETIAITSALISGNTVTIDPTSDLEASTGYYVEVEAGTIRDLAGNDFAGINDPTTWNFTTADAPDTTPPEVFNTDGLGPADDSTNVPSDTNLVIAFNEDIQAGNGNLIIRDADGNIVETIPITPSLISGNTITFDPGADLEPSTGYYIEVESGAIQDLAGNDFAGINDPNTWNFTTTSLSDQPLELQWKEDNSIFRIVGSQLQTTNLKAQLVSGDANYVNEIGLFLVNDEQGTIIDPDTNQSLTPDAGDAYIQAALKQSKILFSAISQNPNGFNPTELSRTIEGFNGGDNLVFYLVSDSTTDAVISGETSTNQVILGATFDSNAFNPVKVTSDGNGQFNLSWEDEVGGGDQSFEDVVFSLQITDESISKGTQSQGVNPAEIIDLTTESGVVNFNYSVHREANYNNEVYFYQIDNAEGLIGSLDPNNSSQADYLQAALDNLVKDALTGEIIKFAADDNNVESGSGTIEGGSLFAPIIIIDGTLQQLTDGDSSNDPQVYFPYVGVNSDGFDHINLLGDNTFGFEDMGLNGDKDYNDLTLKIDFV